MRVAGRKNAGMSPWAATASTQRRVLPLSRSTASLRKAIFDAIMLSPPPLLSTASHMLPKEAIGIHKLAAALLTCVTWTCLQHLRRSTVSRLNQLCLLSNRLIWWLLTMKTGAAANQYTFFMFYCLQARRAQSLLTMRLPLSRTIVVQPRL